MKEIKWDANIPPGDLLKMGLKIMGMAVVIFLIIIEVITGFSFIKAITDAIAKRDPYLGYAAGFIGLWLILSFLFCWALFAKGYEVTFLVNYAGAAMDTRPERRRINRWINGLLFWLSLLSQRPGGMGTAILAEASQSIFVEWTDVQRIVPQPDRFIIRLQNSWRTVLSLYCSAENYQSVLDLVYEQFKAHEEQRMEAAKNAPSFWQIVAKIMVLAGVVFAAFLVWQSPLLDNKAGVVMLAAAVMTALMLGGQAKKTFAYLAVAILIGLIAGMIINAFEPLGYSFMKYYRYEWLEKSPDNIQFGVSLVGMAALAYACLHNIRKV
ncbi:MAG: hypothetical protein N2491_03170 [Negativicutes bacterium]|nr:hypothetical protein [Negativicutes bacterium]